jgi:hypothetical protein
VVLSTTKTPTITIFTGISGIDKKDFLNRLIKKSKMDGKVLLLNFEDELINEERGLSNPIPNIPTFLNSPNGSLKLQVFSSNFSWIAKKIRERKSTITEVFLNMHLSYYKNSEFYPPFIPLYFKEIFAQLPNSKIRIVTLIDDIFVISKKIFDRENSAGFTNTKLTLREILVWRSLEFLHGEALKEYINISEEGSQRANHLMVSIRHPHETFQNLIFKNSKSRIYLSYHISESRKTTEGIDEINKFRKLMHIFGKKENVAIFDPVAIDELAIVFALKKEKEKKTKLTILSLKEKDRWPLNITNLNTKKIKWPIKIPSSEIDEVGNDIINQIKSRDYTLVDTATHLAVYRPYFNGKLSKGVEAEIRRANDNFSDVIVYHPKIDHIDEGNTTHPFGANVTLFDDKNKFIQHLQKVVKQRMKKDK